MKSILNANRAKPKAMPRKQAKPKPEAITLDQAVVQLQSAETQAVLRDSVARLALSAVEWKALAKQLTGRSARSGKIAREMVETYLSDKLLLNERVESVKRQFTPPTPPPAGA